MKLKRRIEVSTLRQGRPYKHQTSIKRRLKNPMTIIFLKVNRLNAPIKKHRDQNEFKKYNPALFCLQETHLNRVNKHRLKVKG